MSNFFEKQLKGLVVILRLFGGLSIIFGALALLASFTGPKVQLVAPLLLLIPGIIYWIVAKGLSKRQKWAWYLGLLAFLYSAVHNFIIGTPMGLVASGLALLFVIILLTTIKSFFATSEN